jgi:hypothetical protein
MTQGFESVRHELDAKRQQLEQDLAAVRGRASEIEADLERVHEALGALTGSKRKASKSRPSRSKKPAATVEDLQACIALVRERNPFFAAAELESSVRAMLKDSGSSLSGFKMLFAEALLTSPGPNAPHNISLGAQPGVQHQAEHHSHSGHGHSSHAQVDDGPFSG